MSLNSGDPTNCTTESGMRGPGLHAKYLQVEDEFARERRLVLETFMAMLAKVTGDGSKKRQRGEKPPWYEDLSHKAAVFSHFRRRELGELVDPDSGAHPYVHAAWRLLAIAYQETEGQVDPGGEHGELVQGRG